MSVPLLMRGGPGHNDPTSSACLPHPPSRTGCLFRGLLCHGFRCCLAGIFYRDGSLLDALHRRLVCPLYGMFCAVRGLDDHRLGCLVHRLHNAGNRMDHVFRHCTLPGDGCDQNEQADEQRRAPLCLKRHYSSPLSIDLELLEILTKRKDLPTLSSGTAKPRTSDTREPLCPLSNLRFATSLGNAYWRFIWQYAGCEALRQNRPKDGSSEHQHEHHIEQTDINEALACTVKGVIRYEGGSKGRRHLRQRQRPYRQTRRRAVMEG